MNARNIHTFRRFLKGGGEMRRLVSLLSALLFLLLLAGGVSAATNVSELDSQSVLQSDGSCQVTLQLRLHLDGGEEKLAFPLPGNASAIRVNGTSAGTYRDSGLTMVNLSPILGGLAGDFTLTLQYRLPNGVRADDGGKLTLTLPLLSGFAYPIERMTLTVRFPGELSGRPSFSSGYYRTSVESILTWSLEGDTLTAEFSERLKDHETLALSMTVPEELFPQKHSALDGVQFDKAGMYACAALAVLYYLLFLRALPPRRLVCTTAPEGVSAGEIRAAMTGCGADLTGLVFSWAQMGYVLIYLGSGGKITLHKRMEMGNERSAFEVRCFRRLFGKRSAVNATGQRYARLAREIASERPPHGWFLPRSGNPKVMRVLSAGVGLFGGMSLGMSLGGGTVSTILLAILFSPLGAMAAWQLQNGAYAVFSRDRNARRRALVIAALWLLLGVLAKCVTATVFSVAAQLVLGLMAVFGGRRTASGRQAYAEALGLRRYLRTVPRAEVRRLSLEAPDYFFTLAPYALALGVGRTFAKRFGGQRLPSCPYLTTGMDAHMTASEWANRIARAAHSMDAMAKLLPYERLIAGLSALTAPAPQKKRKKPARPRQAAARQTTRR